MPTTAPALTTQTVPVPIPVTPFEKRIAASPVYTEHVSVGGKRYEIHIVFLRELPVRVPQGKMRIVFYKLYISDPSGVKLYSATGSLWKTTKFLEYFREHNSFLTKRALRNAADLADRVATAEATKLYGTRVD